MYHTLWRPSSPPASAYLLCAVCIWPEPWYSAQVLAGGSVMYLCIKLFNGWRSAVTHCLRCITFKKVGSNNVKETYKWLDQRDHAIENWLTLQVRSAQTRLCCNLANNGSSDVKYVCPCMVRHHSKSFTIIDYIMHHSMSIHGHYNHESGTAFKSLLFHAWTIGSDSVPIHFIA